VTFVQDYVAAYRVPLYDALHRRLAEHDIRLVVLHGERGTSSLAKRGDAAVGPWSRVTRMRSVALGAPSVVVRSIPTDVRRSTGLWVLPLRAADLTTWSVAISGKRYILWGHGKNYVSADRWIADAPESLLARRARHLFLYAEGGRSRFANEGYPADRMTVVGNAADGPQLRRLHDELAPARGALRAELGIADGPSALFIGGLDSSKRIEFLVAAAGEAHRLDPRFHLYVGGAGEDVSLLEGMPFVTHVGRLDTVGKARWATACDALWNPGLVGLVVLDAIAVRRRILISTGSVLAPEIEFAREPVDYVVLPDDPGAYAREALEVMASDADTGSETHVASPEEVAGRMATVIEQQMNGIR
jgi:glycosyltransferase involved in cell wall biosynthesis